jgi:hypothetical protein
MARDNLSEAGARVLAQRIAEFWAARGGNVSTWVERISTSGGKLGNTGAYAVRSSLLNGMPDTSRG